MELHGPSSLDSVTKALIENCSFTAQKLKFSRVSSVNVTDLVTFIEEILNGKFHFLVQWFLVCLLRVANSSIEFFQRFYLQFKCSKNVRTRKNLEAYILLAGMLIFRNKRIFIKKLCQIKLLMIWRKLLGKKCIYIFLFSFFHCSRQLMVDKIQKCYVKLMMVYTTEKLSLNQKDCLCSSFFPILSDQPCKTLTPFWI